MENNTATPTDKRMRIARNGEEIGQWPYDVVMALVRAGHLSSSDHYWVEGMEEWEELESVIPPSPSRNKPFVISGKESEEDVWFYYCREKGNRIVGPRTQNEIIAMLGVGGIQEEDLLFFPGADRWMSAWDFIRLLEKEYPGIGEEIRKIREVVNPPTPRSPDPDAITRQNDGLGGIIEESISAFASSPLKGGFYVGTKVLPKLLDWLGTTHTQK